MGGVVYAGSNGSLGQLGGPISIGAGAPIPPGSFFLSGAWSAMVGGTARAMPAGFAVSDGNATATAALSAYPLGAGNPYTWPWPVPWPLSQMPWPPPS